MSLLDPRERTICLKVVYYGPALGGKTTSLKHIHRVIDPEGKTRLVSLDTDQDRTLFFDFLPIEVGLVGRFKVKIQGFTVPGQVKYNMTRRYVLTGADGIVFVADSDPNRVVENVESLINLGDNLRAHGLSVNEIPLVFQYNKQDLPEALPPEELDKKLNFRGVPAYATVATEGRGVFDAFVAVARAMVAQVLETYRLEEESSRKEEILREVEQRLWSLAGQKPPAQEEAREAPSRETDAATREALEFFGEFHAGPAGGEAGVPEAEEHLPVPEEALAEARGPGQPQRGVESRTLFRWLLGLGQGLAEPHPLRACGPRVLEAASEAFDALGASLLIRDPRTGHLRAWCSRGLRADPLAALGESATSVLTAFEQGADQVVLSESSGNGLLQAMRQRNGMVQDAVCAPLLVNGKVQGALAVYTEERIGVGRAREALKVLLLLAHQAAAALRIESLLQVVRTKESGKAVRSAT